MTASESFLRKLADLFHNHVEQRFLDLELRLAKVEAAVAKDEPAVAEDAKATEQVVTGDIHEAGTVVSDAEKAAGGQ